MIPTARTSFDDARDLAERRLDEQRWQAAQTVRAHTGPGERRDDLLSCLGLTDVVAPTA